MAQRAVPLQSVAFFFPIGIIQQKTEQSFWRGFGGRNRHPIGGLGENPPILLASLISDTKSKNVRDASIIQLAMVMTNLPITNYQLPITNSLKCSENLHTIFSNS
ncbi:hypothetical protein NIES3275_22600 [Microchaete diplosiphon NIES-3275]|nr:hypothetical protein NIES3275_22600 [Microchaete diplosiphon NIES-3275]